MMLPLLGELASYQHIIWDLNGTLIDDVDICIEAVNPILEEHGLPVINLSTYQEKFRFPVSDYYHDLGFRLSKEEFDALSNRFHESYHRLLPTTQLFHGTAELLTQLKKQGKILSILTAAWHEDLHRIVRHFGIHESFDHFYGLQHRLADSKIQRGRELLSATRTNPKETVLLGDTLHDLEVGEALGVHVILLTAGHMSEARLQKSSAKVIRRG